MKLVVSTFLSMDGVLQGPGGPDEDRSDGFDQGGWQVPYAADDADLGRIIVESFEAMEALLLGRRTYEIFAAYWPRSPTRTTRSRCGSTAPPSTSRPPPCPRWSGTTRI